jgi:alanine racemase
MNSTAICTVDLQAIKHNYELIHRMMPSQKILAMIKSNAYGHGLVHVAKTLSHADALGVATISEAQQLRNANIETDIIVMRGFACAEELAVFEKDSRLIACVHDVEQIALLQAASLENKKIRIWMKIDTGMHRLGFSCEQFQDAYQTLNQLSNVEKPFVICSHLADADNNNPTFTNQQIAAFEKMTKHLSNEKSVLNSAGILAHAHAHYDWIRPGLLLYGVSPFDYPGKHDAIIKNFIPAMTFESKLIAVKNVNANEKIGYSCTFTTPHAMKIGIVGMGYGDSYPRHAKNGTPVLIRDERCSIVGRVSMDMMNVDVTHVKNVMVGDTVILWGRDLLVSEIAKQVNTVSHELLCHLTGRVHRVYLP